ncbi:hypothetical protein PR048_029866 [Dryococelus australis]|uniref:Uncharacterized protein n=1 Tax=Dryococelus australis TaxID=614101 RepID=A0ABQ9G7D2_9NEOP|nr:hypothetical protein PR048_029866 [Dryococelus australis]
MSSTSVWHAITMALDPLNSKADKLVGKRTPNQSERHASFVSKFSRGGGGGQTAIVEGTKDVALQLVCHMLRDRYGICRQQNICSAAALAIYGRVNESKVINIFQEKLNEQVTPFGLFIRPEYPIFGASPDGLVGDGTSRAEMTIIY